VTKSFDNDKSQADRIAISFN